MMPAFDPSVMLQKYGDGSTYETAARHVAPGRVFPSLYFFSCLMCGPFRWLYKKAAAGLCDDTAWVYSSAWVGDIFENSGGRIVIDGLQNLKPSRPCVYIANHMSTLETFLLPSLLRPKGKLTFVVKKSLTELPFFGVIMRSRNPVVVERKNPREDLAVMLGEGAKRLEEGYSIVVFPQSTRCLEFSREHFNSIGVKLAARAKVPVIPIALKTDVWGMGKKIKELGRINPALPLRIKIGGSMEITGNGKVQHNEICEFIEKNLLDWQKQDGINK